MWGFENRSFFLPAVLLTHFPVRFCRRNRDYGFCPETRSILRTKLQLPASASEDGGRVERALRWAGEVCSGPVAVCSDSQAAIAACTTWPWPSSQMEAHDARRALDNKWRKLLWILGYLEVQGNELVARRTGYWLFVSYLKGLAI